MCSRAEIGFEGYHLLVRDLLNLAHKARYMAAEFVRSRSASTLLELLRSEVPGYGGSGFRAKKVAAQGSGQSISKSED